MRTLSTMLTYRTRLQGRVTLIQVGVILVIKYDYVSAIVTAAFNSTSET